MNRLLRTAAAFLLVSCSAAALPTATTAGTAPASSAAPPCRGGNLLAQARVSDSLDVQGRLPTIVDDFGGPDGGVLAGSQGIHFLSAAGSLTYDLGVDRPIVAALVQAEAANGFSLQISEDATSFREIWSVPDMRKEGRGLRTRFVSFSGLHARYVRFGEPTGPGARSVSEVQVFCELPATWLMPLTLAPKEPPSPPAPWTLAHFIRVHGGSVRMVLALLGAMLLAWGYSLGRRGGPRRFGRLRDALLLTLALLGYAAYYNWGFLHFGGRIHYHEFFHYYIGAKYFPELGYTHLYECTNLAEAEQGFRRRVELRTIRDLRQNELVSAKYVLEDPERYKQGFSRPFTPKRWEEFKRDIAFFRSNVDIGAWENMLRDHGYNPSPLWNMTGSILANLGPASKPFLEGVLFLIDPLLLLIAFGFVVWAFGWRVACVSILFFGTNEPALFFWTGGAFLRQDWFMAAMVGICLLKRGKPALGGASLAVSTLLRVFPLAFLVAIGLRVIWVLLRERRIDPVAARIVAGAALATAILIPASSVVAGSASAWPEFLKNTRKHAASPLTNYMGLRTIVGFRMETRQKYTVNPNAVDPFHEFREARKRAFAGIFGQPLFLVLVAAYLGLLMWAVRKEMEWWVLAAFGFGVIAVGMELTCYYYSFLAAAAFLWEKRPAIPIGLLVLSALGHVIAVGTYYYDMRYYCESIAVIAFVVWATWIYGRGAAVTGAGAGAATPTAP